MSGSWTSGYVADIGYTYGFYRELTPAMLNMALALRNQATASLDDKLAYCELGCGQGITSNLLAAANPEIEFYATDFNPSQIAGAQALAKAAGTTNVHFYDQSFQEFIDNPDLPAFDFISLHGIYSWISQENRQAIVRFIARHLKPGGAVYISYNTMPGWASIMPLRQLLVQQAATSTGPIVPRIDQALAFATKLMDGKARYFTANPVLKERVEQLQKQPRQYLAHEYMNRDWTPFYFADVVNELSDAKLGWTASANLTDHVENISLAPDHQAILNEIGDAVRRESIRDYLVNQQFRRDIFVRGSRTLPTPIASRQLLSTRFVLAVNAADVPLTINTTAGQVKLHEETYRPVLDSLERGSKTLGELLAEPAIAAVGVQRVIQVLTVITGTGHIYPALPQKGEARRRSRTDAFNKAVLEIAESSSDLQYLASPVSGSGHTYDRIQMLFLTAMRKGGDAPEFVWNNLRQQNQRLLKDGKALETPEENLAELRARFADFQTKVLPFTKRLGII
ncbi:hypothetical protein IP70_21540 [alpha proteobacterium AAP38]|nr:hypothetical protein IP70_21540 [alpha proteobacterium AAP38]